MKKPGKHLVLIYIILAIVILLESAAVGTYLYFHTGFGNTYTFGILIPICVGLAFEAVLIGIAKGRKIGFIIAEPIALIAVCLGIYYGSRQLLPLLNDNNVTVCVIASALYFLLVLGYGIASISALHGHLMPNGLNTAMAILLTVSMTVAVLLPSLKSVLSTVFEEYTFTSAPSVYYSSDENYCVIFSTNFAGTGEVHVTDAEGNHYTYYDQENGVENFDSIFHKVAVPMSVLDGGSYTVASRKTLNGRKYGISLDSPIESKVYNFHGYEGNGDLSFLCISDVQGAYIQAQSATAKAKENYDYDFVLMLGDGSSYYNDYEEDFIESNLKITAAASGSEIPCLYCIGNHENKGELSKEFLELMTTPSEDGELYYTIAIGDAYFTVLNFGDDHNDDMARYNGANHFNDYKDKEYDWLLTEVMAKHEYENYRYNVIISHIPAINSDNYTMDKYICKECNEEHTYKWAEFIAAYNAMGVQYIVSGHTHKVPQEFTAEGCNFVNLQTGSNYDNTQHFRNSIVTLKDGNYSFEVYSDN